MYYSRSPMSYAKDKCVRFNGVSTLLKIKVHRSCLCIEVGIITVKVLCIYYYLHLTLICFKVTFSIIYRGSVTYLNSNSNGAMMW